jgi:hypothetical protein
MARKLWAAAIVVLVGLGTAVGLLLASSGGQSHEATLVVARIPSKIPKEAPLPVRSQLPPPIVVQVENPEGVLPDSPFSNCVDVPNVVPVTIQSCQPLVTWGATLTDGFTQVAQQSSRVVIYTLAATQAVGFLPGITQGPVDSGVRWVGIGGCCTFGGFGTAYPPLAPGQWVAYVQVTDTAGAVSPWAPSPFTIP